MNPGPRWSTVSRQIVAGVLMELVLVSLALTWAGLGIVDSIAAAVLLIVLVRIVLALASFLLAWCFRSRNRDQEPLGPLRLIALVAGETVSFLRLFFVYHAFEPWLNAHDPTPQSEGRTPPAVLFVHGFYANAGFWYRFKRRFTERGFGLVYSLNLDPPFADIEALADLLARRVRQVCEHSRQDQLILVGHSMGGLVCRSYLLRYGEQNVRRLITVGTPHHGTVHAYLLPGANLRQMRPNSEWLTRLNECSVDVPHASIYSVHDNIIAPQDSSRLQGAKEVVLTGVGHLSMAFSDACIDAVLGDVERVFKMLDKPK